MSINEAIEWLQKDKDRWETIGNEVRAEACEMAIVALTILAERLVLHPLTMEQLQKMEDSPLWVVPLKPDSDWKPHWCIFHDGYAYASSITRKGALYFLHPKDYYKTWIAYRDKPGC